MFKEEIWRDIIGYEGLYQVSSYGHVRSVDRTDNLGRPIKGKILKPVLNNCGYLKISLSKNGQVQQFLVSRLVAMAFIHNPEPIKFSQVGHLDDNKLNNHVDNLYWTDAVENQHHNGLSKRMAIIIKQSEKCKNASKKRHKAVIGISMTNQEDRIYFASVKEAKQYDFTPSNIAACCRGYRNNKSHRGYRWYWAKEVI